MGMDGSGLTVADALALQDRNRGYDDGMFGGNGSWVFFLFFLLAWGNGGWGLGNNGALNGALTRADLCQDMNFQQLENAVRGVQQGLCDGFYAQNTTMLQGFNSLQRDLCSGFNAVSSGINDLGYRMQNCCCETNRNIDNVRYEAARNTCDIINAGHADAQRIVDVLTQNQIQDLRDKLAEKDREVQSRDFQLSQQAQNSYLISELRPCSKPAYITCSPYESAFYGDRAYGRGNYNYGCDCNRCCN